MTGQPDLTCRACKNEVTGYTSHFRWQFVDGVRMLPLITAVLSCGCELIEPTFAHYEDDEMMLMKDPYSGDQIIRWIERSLSDDRPFG